VGRIIIISNRGSSWLLVHSSAREKVGRGSGVSVVVDGFDSVSGAEGVVVDTIVAIGAVVVPPAVVGVPPAVFVGVPPAVVVVPPAVVVGVSVGIDVIVVDDEDGGTGLLEVAPTAADWA
jgi:hypothetical protein